VHTNQLTGSIPSLATNTKLVGFYAHANQLTGSIPSLATNTELVNFSVHTNQLTGSIPSLATNTKLMTLYVYANQLTGSIPSLATNTKLVGFYADTNQLTGYTASTIATTCTTFRAEGNALSLAAVDQILTDFTDNAAARPLVGTINISGGTNAVPTPAVKAACLTALQTAPWAWTITTN